MTANERRLRLSVQAALVGEITPDVVAVTAGLDGDLDVAIHVYFSRTPSVSDAEQFDVLATQILADFTDAGLKELKLLSIADQPLRRLDFWAFVRHGFPYD